MTAYTKGAKKALRRSQRHMLPAGRRRNEVVREQTFTTRALIEPENLRWFVLRVQSQQEERVIRSLDLRAIPAAVPTVPKERKRRGTTYRWRSPIAHGYVLVGIPGTADIPWWDLLQIDYVWSPVKDDQGYPAQAPWRTSYEENGEIKRGGVEVLLPELAPVRATAAEFMRRAKAFEKEKPVQVKGGPFAGFDGIVEDATDAEVTVLLSIFGRHTRVIVPVSDVKRVKVEKAA